MILILFTVALLIINGILYNQYIQKRIRGKLILGVIFISQCAFVVIGSGILLENFRDLLAIRIMIGIFIGGMSVLGAKLRSIQITK